MECLLVDFIRLLQVTHLPVVAACAAGYAGEMDPVLAARTWRCGAALMHACCGIKGDRWGAADSWSIVAGHGLMTCQALLEIAARSLLPPPVGVAPSWQPAVMQVGALAGALLKQPTGEDSAVRLIPTLYSVLLLATGGRAGQQQQGPQTRPPLLITYLQAATLQCGLQVRHSLWLHNACQAAVLLLADAFHLHCPCC